MFSTSLHIISNNLPHGDLFSLIGFQNTHENKNKQTKKKPKENWYINRDASSLWCS